MGTFVHDEFKAQLRVPAGRLLYVYTTETGDTLATLTDIDDAAIDNPIVLDPDDDDNVNYGEYSGRTLFKCAATETLWGITDYDLDNGVTARRPLLAQFQNDVDLGGLTASADELNQLDGVTAGTVTASKAVVVGTNKNIDTIVVADGGLKLGSGAGTAVTSTAAELNLLDTSVAGTAVASKALVLGANKNVDTLTIADNGLKLGAGAGTAVTASAAQLNSCDASVGAAAGTGVVAAETGFGHFKTTTLTLTNTPVVMADEPGQIAYGGLKIYDFPQGYIYMVSACADLAITKSSAGVNDDWDGDIAFGTVTAGNDADLTSTEEDIIPKTATPQAAAGATTGDCVSTATEHAILDGTSTAKDLFVNILVDDADHNVTGTACNLILNGTVTVNWIYMGDN